MGVPIEPLPIRRRKKLRTLASGLALLTVIYLLAAYLLLPGLWTWFYDDHPVDAGMLTTTPQGIPGDPINVGLVGSREEILHAFADAGWDPADAITIRSSVEIGLSVVLDRPDLDAPVSTLLYEGRRQDLAFEKPVGSSADKRNHVRLWQTERRATDALCGSAGRASIAASASATTRARSPITSGPTSMPSATGDADLKKVGIVTSTTSCSAAAPPGRPQWRRRPLFHRRHGAGRRAEALRRRSQASHR